MATMVKEKRREKKKTKDKPMATTDIERDQTAILSVRELTNSAASHIKSTEIALEKSTESLVKATSSSQTSINTDNITIEVSNTTSESTLEIISFIDEKLGSEKTDAYKETCFPTQIHTDVSFNTENNKSIEVKAELEETSNKGYTYQDLNSMLERIAVPSLSPSLAKEEIERKLESQDAYLQCTAETKLASMENQETTPSAPLFEEEEIQQEIHHQENVIAITKEVTPTVQCMPLEEVVRLYGGAEMAAVRAMSEREEAIVEAGPISGPEHPLVDLLSTFRSSLIAVDRERTQLVSNLAQEEKSRNALWKIEKRTRTVGEKCPCDAYVTLTASYEHAELLKDKLPVAKMRLEALLRDVQESYCHHTHAALLAHCQIEELISETIQGSKPAIREALSLVLQALRLSDSAPDALATALQRWATILSAAMLDGRDLRQLLHLLHHLFRQTRSVQWAAHVLRISVTDGSAAAQAIAVLDLLLARPRLEPAVECTEDAEEGWEEVDKHGSGCAVSEGTLRERDLLALLYALPLRDLVARLVLFTHSDIKQAREHEWGDASGGRGVFKACCGVRALLATLQRAALVHVQYPRLRAVLRSLAANALHALAGLHLHSRASYSKELEPRVARELEAALAAGISLLGTELRELPATLLSEAAARHYCIASITRLHDNSPIPLEVLSTEMPAMSCDERVRVVTQAAMDRVCDHELARIVLEFLFQTGIKRKATPCKGSCDVAARDMLPQLLAAHPYLHTIALHILAELNQEDMLNATAVLPLSIETWRPTNGEVRAVLNDWALRCPHLIQHLLLGMDYSVHIGTSLEAQLSIGAWLCQWTQQAPPAPDWAWCVLRRLRVHRACRGEPLDAPPPDSEPADLLAAAYAVMASSWGHCVPLICSDGVAALCRIAAVRARDAVHCLAPVMQVMACSPESVSLTPKFNDLFSMLLCSGPTLVQRALGRGPASGSELLLRLILAQLDRTQSRFGSVSSAAMVSAWLHALWRATPPPAYGLLDTVLLACREWKQFDSHAELLLQEENVKDMISDAVRNASQAPLMCECVLRNAHAQREARTQLTARLLDALHLQRRVGDRIHVDNALKHIGAGIGSEELVVYRAANAALAAPLQHPSHLTLWRLFFHLYLQRPPSDMQESTAPIGPLFFSGLIKSRTVAQLRKRLQDTALYHRNEAATNSAETAPKGPPATKLVKSSLIKIDNSLLPALSIDDLTGESSESSESSDYDSSLSDEDIEVKKDTEIGASGVTKKDVFQLLCYHVAAEKMIREFTRWLDEGEKVRAMPHHADIARFIPEQALEAAWSAELARRRPSPDGEAFPLPAPAPPPARAPAATPFHKALHAILKIRDRSSRRIRTPSIKPPVQDVNFKDVRMLLKLVDKHLDDIERLAREWSSEVTRISALDSQLWELVGSLRVSRPLPPVRKACPNKCAPLTLVIPEREWCISSGAERGIRENRSSALAALRRLARPRPHAASTAAALHTIASRVRTSEAACRVVERAWRCAGAAAHCAPAHAALTTLVSDLAERWLCHDGKVCAELVSRWSGGGALQQRLCGALVSPRRLRAGDWPALYAAVLRARLPSHAVFSYLSKFELSRWSETADGTQRRDMLDALSAAAQRWGVSPDAEHHVLLELIGVHTATLTNAQELCALVVRCARASVARTLPPSYWTHVVRAADMNAKHVPFDQLGHLLRELGVIWWEARSGLKGARGAPQYALYAPYIARLLHALQRAFVGAAVALSYALERVAAYAWSALHESWAPWLSPHLAAPPLLPPAADAEPCAPMMLRHFLDSVHQIMLDCPGSEEHLLRQIFEWSIQTYVSVAGVPASQECRAQASALLAELATLPWTEHQWFHGSCLQPAIQICANGDKEIASWCSDAWRGTTAETWLRDLTDEELAPRLAALLYLFSGMPQNLRTLEEATRLPWGRLPEPALDEALERFFAQHHNPALPYHDLLQFRVMLYASELCIHPDTPPARARSAQARGKRSRAVSQWARAACAPALSRHVSAHTTRVLNVIADIAPYLEGSDDEIEELLSRAVILLCMEPAATAALPVWERWVSATSPRLVAACLSAAAVLTAFEYFASLADAAARAHLALRECGGWGEVRRRWSRGHWADAAPLAARGRLHAAYGVARAHPQPEHALRTALLALLTGNVNFIENEVIIAVWICFACRIARECAGGSGERGECRGAAQALLARGSEEPRRSLLRAVTLQADTSAPTAQHRLLSRFAQCILTPESENAVRAYEASCSAVLGAHHGDVAAWGRAPRPKQLPRLAMRLFPKAESYFSEELELAPEDT